MAKDWGGIQCYFSFLNYNTELTWEGLSKKGITEERPKWGSQAFGAGRSPSDQV